MFVCLKIIASIFYQILSMSIIASIISLVILLIQKIIKNKFSPKCYYYIWIVFILSLIVPISLPSKISVYNYIDINNIKIIENKHLSNKWNIINYEKEEVLDKVKSGVCNNNYDIKILDLRIIVADVFIIISIMKVLRTVISHFILMYEFGNNEFKDERIINILNDCKNKLKIKRKIKLINQNIANSPAIIGVINVKILLNQESSELDDESLKNIFMHELSHYKRKDTILNILIMILSSLYWFNPFVKNSFKYIKQYMEFSTDELAIKNMNIEETRDYCRTIVEVAKRRSSIKEPVLGFSGELNIIRKRIDFISLKPQFNKFSKVISIFTVFMISIICLMFYPTSYGFMSSSNLFFQTDNEKFVEIVNQDGTYISESKKVKLKSSNLKINDYMYFYEINTEKNNKNVINILENDGITFEKGEHFYNFTVANTNGKMYNYIIKIIVE